MKRYNNIEYIMNMEIEDGLNLITKAYKNDTKDKLYQMYVIHSAFMDKDNYISFEQYYNNATRQVKIENKDEVYNKVDNILKAVCKEN
jgi:hypothetical protein